MSALTVTNQSLTALARQQTVWLTGGIFTVLVMISAYLGWSATSTVNAIYADAAAYLQAAGQPVPPNPVTETSPLGLLRNLSIYISLIGCFAAIVVGQSLIETDRRAGVLPLIGSRALPATDYVGGKIAALTLATGAMTLAGAIISVATFIILPNVHISGTDALHLVEFFVISWAYMALFGLVALGAAARFHGAATGLLVASILWLSVTFVLPALTGNIHPTAAINPVSALAPAPDMTVFQWLGVVFGPLSFAESYKYISADLLGFLPDGALPRGAVMPLADLLIAFFSSAFVAVNGLSHLSFAGGADD